jgi:type IV pilus assembly protein PilC
MNYAYIAYDREKKLVKGKLSATSEDGAAKLLNYGGYKVLSIKPHIAFFNFEKLAALFSRVSPREIVMFSRQLALLLESGTDIVGSLELLQGQVTNRTLQRVLGDVASDIRSGSSLSVALTKHPRAFSPMFARAMAAGERSGNLEVVLRQMAEFLERGVVTEKKIKNALTYPVIVLIVAVIVVALMVTFILPEFLNLYTAFGTDPPASTRILISGSEWLVDYGAYLFGAFAIAVGIGFAYIRTPNGKYMFHKALLRMPVIGRIILLGELSRACRTMALLFKVGLPLPEIMSLAIQGSNNKAVTEAMTGVQHDLIRGEGLSKPMAKRPLFLPLMVQMVGVGEETGNLDNTLATVAESYEVEADDRTSSAVGLIQPIITIVIGLVIGFIALTLVSSMYSMYPEL